MYAWTHLVKVLQEVDYPTLDLVLVQTGGRRVETDRLRREDGSELSRAGSGRAADVEGSRRAGGIGSTGDGSPQRADNGGAEHDECVCICEWCGRVVEVLIVVVIILIKQS